jgi:hypothetical protein
MSYKRQSNDISLIQLSNYVKPEIKEYLGKKWVLNGDKNSFFQYVIDRYNGSVTNESVINTFCELIYGKGISINGQNEIYDELNEIFNKREQKKCIADRKIFGQYAMQILRAKGGGIAKILHLPMNKLGMELADDNGDVNNVYYCDDWRNPTKYTPKRYPIFKGKMTESIMVKMVQPYKPGKFYFSDPDYLASLQYAELEEEISNFSINHIKNNLSFGYVVNMNNGAALTPEQKDQIEFKIKQKLTGSSNAGNFILSFNDGKENEVTVIPLNTNAEAHQQWESLQKIASEKIILSHGAFPALFGMETSTGFSSNAEELDTQSKLVQDFQVSPIQNEFIDELSTILELAGLETDLSFIPLRDTYKSTETVEEEPIDDSIDEEEVVEDNVELSAHNVEMLINLGEDINYEEWDLVDDRRCDEITLKESDLNTVFEFASVPKSDARTRSEQDTSLFKIRYRYAGRNTIPNAKDVELWHKTGGEQGVAPMRGFCQTMLKANKLYKAEDLDRDLDVNSQFAPSGENVYNIFKFKGGVNCKHWWQRVIFLKKGNTKIGVNQAKKMILALEPEQRADAKWETNDKRVAQVAEKQNNYWSLKPNYRDSGVTEIKKD